MRAQKFAFCWHAGCYSLIGVSCAPVEIIGALGAQLERIQDCVPKARATEAKSSDEGKSQALYNNVQPRPGRAANDDCLPQLSQALRTGCLCGTI